MPENEQGHDKVYNEHLINGGPVLYEQLAVFYTEMYNYGYIPQGIIITLHKGGNKSKTDPNSYRDFTLSSAILKLFEKILLGKIENSITRPLNWLQGGFRPNIGCNMTSGMLKECIVYAKENRSKLYVCYLGVQKAFDRVWHYGLFLKLYEMGIKSKLLKVIIALHTDTRRRVYFKGHKSNWFDILQVNRQEEYYLPCFTLLEELSMSTTGLKIFGNMLCSIVVADDMLLASLSKRGLDELMQICFRYSFKWHYEICCSEMLCYGLQTSPNMNILNLNVHGIW